MKKQLAALIKQLKKIPIIKGLYQAWNNRIAALETLDIQPDNPNAWNKRGIALFDLGKYEEAIDCYDRAL